MNGLVMPLELVNNLAVGDVPENGSLVGCTGNEPFAVAMKLDTRGTGLVSFQRSRDLLGFQIAKVDIAIVTANRDHATVWMKMDVADCVIEIEYRSLSASRGVP